MANNRQLEHHEHVQALKQFPICILIDDFDVPMNVGSIFRLSDALGVEKLYLTGKTPAPPNRKITKTSRSTEKHVRYEYAKDADAVVNSLTGQGYTIIALEITPNSVDLDTVDYSRLGKICLIVGSEDKGIKASLLNSAHYTVHVPMLVWCIK